MPSARLTNGRRVSSTLLVTIRETVWHRVNATTKPNTADEKKSLPMPDSLLSGRTKENANAYRYHELPRYRHGTENEIANGHINTHASPHQNGERA